MDADPQDKALDVVIESTDLIPDLAKIVIGYCSFLDYEYLIKLEQSICELDHSSFYANSDLQSAHLKLIYDYKEYIWGSTDLTGPALLKKVQRHEWFDYF